MPITLPEVSTPVFALIAAIWLIILAAGRHQLKNIKENTVQLVLEQAREQLKKDSNLDIDQFYASIYPQWRQMVKSKALFIPHKTELWPMPAYPEYVCSRIKFNPQVVADFLSENGIILRGVEIALPEQDLPINPADSGNHGLSFVEQLCNLFAKYQKRY
ncbi:MAG: hypothetical protein LWX83_04375 [Anaerolineae bacterium]|nr:hypothetical protein [Anaerolineae bacterium]